MDFEAASLLQSFNVNNVVALRVDGDGSCLFNAVSLWMSGDQSKASKLRLHTAIELLNNYEHYRSLPAAHAIETVCPTLDGACLMCASPVGFSSAYTIQALCNVLQYNIQVLYPKTQNIDQVAYDILNTTYKPTRTESCIADQNDDIQIMWSRVGSVSQPNTIWQPNHFVALANVPLNDDNNNCSENVEELSTDVLTPLVTLPIRVVINSQTTQTPLRKTILVVTWETPCHQESSSTCLALLQLFDKLQRKQYLMRFHRACAE